MGKNKVLMVVTMGQEEVTIDVTEVFQRMCMDVVVFTQTIKELLRQLGEEQASNTTLKRKLVAAEQVVANLQHLLAQVENEPWSTISKDPLRRMLMRALDSRHTAEVTVPDPDCPCADCVHARLGVLLNTK